MRETELTWIACSLNRLPDSLLSRALRLKGIALLGGGALNNPPEGVVFSLGTAMSCDINEATLISRITSGTFRSTQH